MKAFLKLSVGLFAATAIAALAATGDSATSTDKSAPSINDLLPDTTVAKGKGFEIKRSQLDQAVIGLKTEAAAHGQEIPPEQIPLLEKQTLDDMLLVKLLNGVATAEQKSKGSDVAGTNFAEVRKRFPTEELMVRQLKSEGMTPDQARASMAEQATARFVLADKANISDADVKKFYDDNPSQMDQPEKLRVAFITMGGPDAVTGAPLPNDQLALKKKQMEDIRDRARKGEDFAKLVQQYSEDANTKDHGGEIMLVHGMRGLPPEFETAAFALQTNEVSDVITTQFGYHLIKMEERVPAKKATLDEASADIRRYLESQSLKKMLPQYFAQLKKDAGVEILDPQLKELIDAPAPGQSGAVDTVPGAKAGAN